jgi:hypothetical protein
MLQRVPSAALPFSSPPPRCREARSTERNMATLFIAFGALTAVLIAWTALDPWAPSPGTPDTRNPNAAADPARMMEAIALSCF